MAKSKVAAIKPKRKTKAKTGGGLMGEFSAPAPEVKWEHSVDVEPMTPEKFKAQFIKDVINEPEREKVYCFGCRYFYTTRHYWVVRPESKDDETEWCRAPQNRTLKDSPIKSTCDHANVWKVNANNDCKYREEWPHDPPQPAPPLTFWDRVKGMFR